MATTCWHASSQTTWTQCQYRSLKWEHDCVDREEGGATPVDRLVFMPCIDCLQVFHEVKLEHWYLPIPLTGPFPLSLQCFLLRDAPPVGPCFSVWINMIHGAVPSLSLINNETNSKEKTQRYNLQLGYLSHYNYEGENFLNILKVILRMKYVMRPNPKQHEVG